MCFVNENKAIGFLGESDLLRYKLKASSSPYLQQISQKSLLQQILCETKIAIRMCYGYESAALCVNKYICKQTKNNKCTDICLPRFYFETNSKFCMPTLSSFSFVRHTN